LSFTVTGGQVHDSQVVEEILNTPRSPLPVTAEGLRQRKNTPADQGRRRFADHPDPLQRHQESLLPQALLPAATQIENFFCCIKDWRRIATRHDKLARNFLAAATLVGVLYWIKL
jgi:transposase